MTCAIGWYDGPRSGLRHLFDLADDSPRQIDGYIDQGGVLVARDADGEIVGHLQLVSTAAAGTLELKSLAVADTHRRRGVGRRLVDRALEICREQGAHTLTVTTATADLDNLRFYQRCGFRATTIDRDAFTEAKGYPPQLEADGIAVRDSITLTFLLTAQAPERSRSAAPATFVEPGRRRNLAMTIGKGLIVRLEARPGCEEAVAAFLRGALPLVEDEPETVAWFAFQAGPSSFAIVDVFPDEEGRRAHLEGAVAAALADRAVELLAQAPVIEPVDALATKLP